MKSRIAILPLLFFWLAFSLQAGEVTDIEQQYKEATEKLVCQCGCYDQISICSMQNCRSATPMRAEVREKLQAGMSVDQIVETFVARVGKQVLSAPTMKGFDLAAWVMPFLILCLGLVAVSLIVVKMTRPARAAQEVPPALDSRVEREFKDFEEES